ncbi:hypothetical protein T484DRAFT_1768890 [Baffinella frigidus]|nr:hypothetical protein T484DRAFT_1768890 [Cryptophyta sp. CCMP2293]
MSCFSCLFGSKPESAAGQPSPPAPPAAFAAPAPAAAAPAPAPVAAAAAAEHNDASAKSTVEGKAGVTEVPAQRKDATPAVEQEAASRPPADAAAAAVAGSGPAWVTKAPTSEAGGGEASEGASFSVVGEVGLVGKGLNQAANFQPRATPRTVFGQGAQGGGSVDTNDVDLTGLQVGGSPSPDKGVSPSTPAPPRNVVAVNGAHALNGATAERLLPQAPPRNHRADGEGELTIVGGLHSSEAKAGPWVEEGDAAGEATVRDGDEACRPGAAVMVSARWTSVAYFQQFADQQGVLTRRGPHGGTWYACFPGSQEVAFSTGMHGQFVLAYSTLPSPPSPDPAAPNQAPALPPASLPARHTRPLYSQTGERGDTAADLTPATTQSAQGQSGETMQAIEDSRSRNLLMRNQLQEQAAAENAAQQLQPKTKDATTDASVAVATDAPLAAPRGGKRSARSLSGPLSHRGAGRGARGGAS